MPMGLFDRRRFGHEMSIFSSSLETRHGDNLLQWVISLIPFNDRVRRREELGGVTETDSNFE
jgi:hypothetical protein